MPESACPFNKTKQKSLTLFYMNTFFNILAKIIYYILTTDRNTRQVEDLGCVSSDAMPDWDSIINLKLAKVLLCS